MSDPNTLALPLPAEAQSPESAESCEPIDVNGVYSFPFIRHRWRASLGAMIQGTLLGATGVFLLTQITATPNLSIQMAILGTLLSSGAVALWIWALSDVTGRIKIDAIECRVTRGFASFSVPWAQVSRWRVNEFATKTSDFNSIEIWGTDSVYPRVLPGGRLTARDHHRIRHLLHVFAQGKE